MLDEYLRGSVEKISKEGEGLKKLMRNNFNIAMPQTPYKIKGQNITIEHGY